MTLAFVVLVTVAILAFVAHTQSALLTARTTVSRLESDNLVTSAVEATISDLRMEMLAGASNVTRSNYTSLDPMIVRRRWAMVPSRVVSSSLPATGYENLVKQSLSGSSFYPGSTATSNFTSNGPAASTGNRRAVAVNTTTPSSDGRTLSAYRWDQVALASLSFSNKPLPDWIYVTRQGVPLSGTNLVEAESGNPASTNKNYVVGRYAYQIYDVGGLLDINTAGLPSRFATNAPAKGGVQWADLTALGLSQTQVDELMAARFSATRSDSGLTNRIRYEAERDGFLSPLSAGGNSDTFFYSRQDMIRYFLKLFGVTKLSGLSDAQRAILASLTQDSRFLTSPSWNPAPLGSTERPAIKRETKGGNNSYGKDDLFNPVIVTNTVASSKTFTRPRFDNLSTMSGLKEVAAKAGDPYVLSRFPLDRLQLITRDATATRTNESLIYRYFGLSRSSPNDPWLYDHGTSETSGNSERILYLDEVRNGEFTDDGKPRELDFVEMLKVAISAGSLGKSAGIYNGGSDWANDRDQRVNYQLVQIFANIIDQYDEDGYPTHIQFDGMDFYGVENLPYLQRIKIFMARLLVDSEAAVDSNGKPLKNQPYSIVWLPEVWNPHDRNQPLPPDRPTKFRVVADTLGVAFPLQYRDSVNNTDDYFNDNLDTAEFDPDKNNIELTPLALSQSYEPIMINRTSLGTPSVQLKDIDRKPPQPTDPADPYVDWSLQPPVDSDLAGIASSASFVNLNVAKIGLRYYTNDQEPGITFGMEYQDNSGKWHRYLDRTLLRAGADGGTDSPRGKSKNQSDYVVQNNTRILAFDPRSDRFSTYRIQERDSDSDAYADSVSLRPNQKAGYGMGYNQTASNRQSPARDADYGWTMGFANPTSKSTSGSGTLGYAMGTILQNSTTGTRYTDPDGIQRSGDGILASGTDVEGQMYWPNNGPSRPIILNRPFRSVAELGYVFRDTPGRSLDFFTDKSGDATLLDFFCISETPDDAITSARVSANTRNVKVLESLLKGALRDPVTQTTLSGTRASEAAQALVALTTNAAKGPLLNRSELATQFMAALPVSTSDKTERIKRQREVFVRALADSLETRTWNLLIDLIAQTGRVPNGKTAFKDFRVESERHLWVHLSIDRITGKILNLNVESVHE
ncbi:hypothetical protein DB345_10835 [Spartobacteria bacterium LR76]|nr:hypothetical protein DB345_10835 [Spartobacteria bacterium LR76]